MRKSSNASLAWQVRIGVLALVALGAGLALAGNMRIERGSEKEGTVFDLSGMLEGETRVFGEGSHRLTAAREGDVVRLTRGAEGDQKAIDVACKLATDHCEVVTLDGADSRVVVKIERRLECKNGVGDCEDIDVIALGEGTGANVWVEKLDRCEGQNCPQRQVEVIVSGDGPESHLMFLGGDASHGSVEHLADKALLRCPKGDSTLEVGKDEAGQTFLCPKHAEPMERAESQSKRILVRKKSD